MTTRRWVDWVNVVLGLWLIASPWLLSVATGDRAALWIFWSVGLGIVALAGLAMHKPAVWGSVIGFLLGMGLIASPWIFELSALSSAATNAMIVGTLVIGYAIWAMRIDLTTVGTVTMREINHS